MTPRMDADRRSERRWLIALLAAALALRLAYSLSLDARAPYTDRGGDTGWYLDVGYRFIAGEVDVVVPSGPVYLLFVGAWQRLLGQGVSAILAIRVTQALLSVASVYFAYLIARRLGASARAGLIAAGIMAVSPVFVLEQAQIVTETLYIALVLGGLALALPVIARLRGTGPAHAGALALAGAVFGLAALTRAVFLLYPVVLAVWIAWLGRRRILRAVTLLLAIYGAIVLSWTAYNWARFGQVVIGAQGITSFAYMGAHGWTGPQELDKQLLENAPEHADQDSLLNNRTPALIESTWRAISEDPPGYAWRRVSELGGAYLQPHGTVLFPGESVKELARDWLAGDRSLNGLLQVLRADWFAPKLALYGFHYATLALGGAGIWLTRRRWMLSAPLVGFIVYLTLIHLVLMVTPRYLFPLEPIFVIFAACALALGWQRREAQRTARSAG